MQNGIDRAHLKMTLIFPLGLEAAATNRLL
jgi:hypothetical protein